MTAPQTVNADQAAHWNAAAGDTWVEMQAMLDRLFAEIEARLVDEAFPGAGGRVLDVGCGSGATTLAMARRLGPTGHCLGVDISRPLIEAATRRAEALGIASAAFEAGDAQTFPFEAAAFDAAISRFGVMFFEDPTAAFANIRRAVRPSGKLAFVAWRSPAENPFMTAGVRAARPLLPDLPHFDPDAPGQFAFADADRVRNLLAESGWSTVELEPFDAPGELPAADLHRYVARMGPVGQAVQAMDAADRAKVLDSVLPAFDPFIEDGVARFDMACWMVTARA